MALAITVGMRSSNADGDIYLGAYVTFLNPNDLRRLKDTQPLAPVLCAALSVMPSCSFLMDYKDGLPY